MCGMNTIYNNGMWGKSTKKKSTKLIEFNIKTYQTIPCAPEPIGFKFWYLLSIVNLVSPTSTV